MIKCNEPRFLQIEKYLGGLKEQFFKLPQSVKYEIREIRIRAGKPIILHTATRCMKLSDHNVTAAELNECFLTICQNSLHSFTNEISQGYITIKGGHRVGFSGTAVVRDGKTDMMKDISSLNIRIANEIRHCAESICIQFFSNGLKSAILAGEPLSGKTTMLRDICRILGENYKIALIDERSEISAMNNGIPQLDVGINTDVLNGFPKKSGIVTAIRSLSPQLVVCDEIGDDYDELMECMNMGVKVIVTAHADSLKQLHKRKATKRLLNSEMFDYAIILDCGQNTGMTKEYEELLC